MIKNSTAVLAVADVGETARFYVDKLGFKQNWLWGNPPTFGCIGLGSAELFLCQQPDLARHVDGHMHFFQVGEKLEELYERHRALGAPIVEPIENKSWGVREYTVRDPSGYRLRFGGPPTYERPATATDALPPHVPIEVAPLDAQTYADLLRSVEWHVTPNAGDVLARTLFTIIATDTRDGRAVGVTRVTGDGAYFMIWDVVVRPSYQGQKIGTAMVQRALDEIRRRGAGEGTFVGLFTGKPGFYQTIGFKPLGAMSMYL
jgi:GNAT superfamily N-acetyltransferase